MSEQKSTYPFSLVLPCYNPPENWHQQVITHFNELCEKLNTPIELIIVNDGSLKNVDASIIALLTEEIQSLNFISYSENRGKGYALRKGVEQAIGNKIIYTDIDFPYEQQSLLRIAKELTEFDVVLGRRGSDYYQNTPWARKVISKTLRWVLKTFLRLPSDDSQCGLKGFNQKGAMVFLDTKIDRFLFDLEFIKMAGRKNLKITTAEVHLKPNVIFSKVNFKILMREGWNFLKVLLRRS